MRFHGFDYLRAAGILAVVYIHGCDTNETARHGMKWLGFAVPCFFMMSAFLAQLSVLNKPETGYWEFVLGRLKRLGPPFLVWSAVYLCVRFAKSRATGATMSTTLSGAVFWGDASHQLYFVPLLLYLFVGWAGVMLLARKHPKAAASVCAMGIVGSLLLEPQLQQALPANRWFVAINLAWFPIAILIALALRQRPGWSQHLMWPALCSTIAIGVTGIVNVFWVSLTALALALSIQKPSPTWVSFLSKYSFGVYLVHVLLIEGMQFVSPRLGLSTNDLATTGMIIVAAAAGSYSLCGILGRYKTTRWSVT